MSDRTVYYLTHPDDGREARVVMSDDLRLAVEFVCSADRRSILERHPVKPSADGGEADLFAVLVQLGLVRQLDVAALRHAWRPGVDPRLLPERTSELFWLVASLHACANDLARAESTVQGLGCGQQSLGSKI